MLILLFVRIFVYFYILSLRASSCEAKDYCSQKICGSNENHVLCKYKSQQPSARCINHEKIVSENIKRSILDKINDRRNKIAAGEIKSLPPAENMMKVVWNDELATFAQRLADQCETNVYDVCNNIGQVPVGQTVATVYGESPGLTPASLVDVWYTELLNMNASVVTSYRPSQEVGASHYDYFTQLVWADSSEVGCGGVKYTEVQEQQNITLYRLICNYAPAGNRRGEHVYRPGAQCTGCLNNGSCEKELNALCSPVIKYYSTTEPITKEDTWTKTFEKETVINAMQRTKLGIGKQKEKINTVTSNMQKEDISPFIDEDLLNFDFLSHILNNTKETVTAQTQSTNATLCTGTLAIDDLVEILKKKLSNDAMFKEILATAKTTYLNDSFTDASVSDFVGRIYSKKKDLTTTTKASESDYVNSTLLADLVEAVIFRNADKYTITTVEAVEPNIRFTEAEVSPIKIQAEFANVKMNNEFTGHYFFPEEETEETSESVHTESYYDNNESTNLPVSDVMLELENIKKNSETRDFVDEILESEPFADSPDDSIPTSDHLNSFTSGHKNINKFISEIVETKTKAKEPNVFLGLGDGLELKKERMRRDNKYLRKSQRIKKKKPYPDTRKTCNMRHDASVLHYGDLLGKLASDIEFLKLNNQFHCSRGSTLLKNSKFIIFLKCYLIIINIFK